MTIKILSLLSGLVLCTFVSNAQISKGQLFLSGEFGLKVGVDFTGSNGIAPNMATTENVESFFVTISPRMAYAVKDNLVIGLAPAFSSLNQTNTLAGISNNNLNTQRLGGELFVRKYVPLNSFASFFAEAGTGYYATTKKDYVKNSPVSNAFNKVRGTEFNMVLRPGINVSLSKSANFELRYGSIGYDFANASNDGTNTNNIDLNLKASSIRFGVSFFFN